MTVIGMLGLLVGCAALPGTLELLLVTVGSLLPTRSPRSRGGREGPPADPDDFRLAVVVPAHDEEGGIAACVRSLYQSDPRVTVMVVADNCTDSTARVAREAGARVLVRDEPERRGKGFALDLAFETLLGEGLDGVAVVDADTLVARSFVPAVRARLAGGADAVQCRYRVLNPEGSMRARLMDVALLAFNVLRPRGRDRWGLSAGILGNGFALRAETLARVPYVARSVVEDLEYHLDLVRHGCRVEFADETQVLGAMPSGSRAAGTQRARWEGGRLRMVRETAPGLAREVLGGRLSLLEPLLELLLLPLSWHLGLLALALALPSEAGRVMGAVGAATVGAHVLAALVVGRVGAGHVLALAMAPVYVAWKLTMAPAIARASRRDAGWVRTEREDGPDGP